MRSSTFSRDKAWLTSPLVHFESSKRPLTTTATNLDLAIGVSDPLVEVVTNPKLPRIEPDIDPTSIQVLCDPGDDLIVLRAMTQKQLRPTRPQLNASLSRRLHSPPPFYSHFGRGARINGVARRVQ